MGYDTLEDFFGDIVGKARRGLGLSTADLAEKTGLSAGDIERAEAYQLTPDADGIAALAGVLGLDAAKLGRVAAGWVPACGNDGFESGGVSVSRLILDAGMDVNCYLMRCGATGKAALVDPGAQADRIQAHLEAQAAEVTHILLTHGHGDHVGALAPVKAATGAQVCCCERDYGLLGGGRQAVDEGVEEGWSTRVGEVTVTAVSLPGHTPGGTGFLFDGGAFSGDALFAGSLGGARGQAYGGQLRAVKERLLGLAPDTRVFPGHGPMTTVAEERANNPFFRL